MNEFNIRWSVRQAALAKLPDGQKVLLAVDCANLALSFWREAFPEDKKPEKAVDLALRSVLRKDVFEKELIEVCYQASQSSYYAQDQVEPDWRAVSAADAAHGTAYAATHLSSNSVNSVIIDVVDVLKIWEPINDLYTQAYQPWRNHYKTPDTIALAQEILNDNFDLMPILADALLDAGCPENQANLTRHSKAYSNWAIFNLGV